jgi:hypothetical protein
LGFIRIPHKVSLTLCNPPDKKLVSFQKKGFHLGRSARSLSPECRPDDPKNREEGLRFNVMTPGDSTPGSSPAPRCTQDPETWADDGPFRKGPKHWNVANGNVSISIESRLG